MDLTATQIELLAAVGPNGSWVPLFHNAQESGLASLRWGANSYTHLHTRGFITIKQTASAYRFITLTDAGRAALDASQKRHGATAKVAR